MNAYGVILLIFCILSVLYWILSIADKCLKAGDKKPPSEEASREPKENEINIPVKVLSFKKAMHDISNNV
jgi:hypothetical protein